MQKLLGEAFNPLQLLVEERPTCCALAACGLHTQQFPAPKDGSEEKGELLIKTLQNPS